MNEVNVTLACPQWAELVGDPVGLVRRTAETTLEKLCEEQSHQAAGDREASIVLADDETVQALNRDYRDRDAPTNVLSFIAEESPHSGPHILGDIILARETVVREATMAGISVADHMCHLLVHGVLHLLGYDHETDSDAALMEAREVEVLALLNIADPYAVHPVALSGATGNG